MSRVNRRAAKIDKNQPDLVRDLRKIPGVRVEVGYDDILVGYKGNTYWFEIKSEGNEKKTQDSQKKLLSTWTGHYQVVSTINEILTAIGIE